MRLSECFFVCYCLSHFFQKHTTALKMVPTITTMSNMASVIVVGIYLAQAYAEVIANLPDKPNLERAKWIHVGCSLLVPVYDISGTMLWIVFWVNSRDTFAWQQRQWTGFLEDAANDESGEIGAEFADRLKQWGLGTTANVRPRYPFLNGANQPHSGMVVENGPPASPYMQDAEAYQRTIGRNPWQQIQHGNNDEIQLPDGTQAQFSEEDLDKLQKLLGAGPQVMQDGSYGNFENQSLEDLARKIAPQDVVAKGAKLKHSAEELEKYAENAKQYADDAAK